jgi:hypothetical protein
LINVPGYSEGATAASDAQVSKRISRGGLSAFHHPDVATGAGFPDRFAVGDDKTGHPLDRGSL